MCLGVSHMSIISTLIRLNLSTGLMHVCLLGILFISVVINVFIHLPGNTLLLWMSLSVRTDPTFPFKFIKPTLSTVSHPHTIVLPTN